MKISLGFSGDIAFSEYTKLWYQEPEKIDKDIYKIFKYNDYNILNFESPITLSTITNKNSLAHKSTPDALSFIKNNINNPVLSLANNHMMDFGPKGLLDTIRYIKKEKIPFIGAGKNSDKATDYIILDKDVKIGILAAQYKDYMIATETSPGPAQNKHFKLIKKKIKELKNKVDWVVMVYHGGEEFINCPMPYTRKLYKKFLSWGVDIVVGHHPHTVQGYEKVKNKMIFYSLGNFIFDTEYQRAQKGTDEGLLLRLNFTKDDYTYEYVSLIKDRENDRLIISEKPNKHFKNIALSYHKDWKKEARRFSEIKEAKTKLREYRSMFSISNLYIEKANCENLMPFDELVKKNYIKDLDNPPVFRKSNIFVRKLRRIYRKLMKANYKKFFYSKYASIFK